MLSSSDKIFTNLDGKQSFQLESSTLRGDWSLTADILAKGSQWIISQITDSGLTGRVGGSLTGDKWALLARQTSKLKYFVVNADESEPGTCKDRLILSHEPHKVLEGALLASFAVKASVCYIYIRGEYDEQAVIMQQAIEEAYSKGFLGKNVLGTSYSLDVFIHESAGAYICGEETALLESIQGNKGFPRIRGPGLSVLRLYSRPALVSNTETVAVVPTILRKGASWFRSLGRNEQIGSRIFCISGHVNIPCVVEESVGIPLKELVDDYAGGPVGGWGKVKAVVPGGASTGIIPAKAAALVTMSRGSLQSYDSDIGTGGIIVIGNSCSIASVVCSFIEFYMRESCGQCSPCREGTGWIWRVLSRVVSSKASSSDIDLLLDLAESVDSKLVICALPTGVRRQIKSLFKYFGSDIAQQLEYKT